MGNWSRVKREFQARFSERVRGKFPRPTHHLDGWAIFAKRLETGTFRFPDVRFINGEYEPVEIERTDLILLLEGIDIGQVKRAKRYRRNCRDQAASRTPKLPAPARARREAP